MAARFVPALMLAVLFGASVATATTFHVTPRAGTPLQDAIDAALPGDRLLIAAGTYGEHVVVSKRLALVGNGVNGLAPEIDAGCGPGVAVDVQADDVLLRNLIVRGGSSVAVDAVGRQHLTLNRLIVLEDCAAGYGIRVSGGTRITLTRNLVDAGLLPQWSTAAIAVLAPTAPFKVSANKVSAGGDGLLVWQANVPAGSRAGVVVIGNQVFGNGTGILLSASSGMRVLRNDVGVNGTIGIEVDAGTHDLLLVANAISGNPTDVLDLGSGNCWRRNGYLTGSVAPCP